MGVLHPWGENGRYERAGSGYFTRYCPRDGEGVPGKRDVGEWDQGGAAPSSSFPSQAAVKKDLSTAVNTSGFSAWTQ